MCGIVGTYGHGLDAIEFHSLVAALQHRGPDATGTYRCDGMHPPVWLGHTRLAIIDLSEAANQPFKKHGLVLTFNGEIYNFRELRRELGALGASFETDSDTEVVLEGWRIWNEALLDRLRGMFAFALFDERSGQLVLVRDPFGIKPLFYAVESDRVAFASELHPLVQLARGRLEIDRTALAAALLYDWIPEEHCIWRQIRKVQPGFILRFDRQLSMSSRCYWRLPDWTETEQVDADEIASGIEDSVHAHLIADVEIGVFLSGGVDSSVIAAIAARRNPNLRCYTIRFRAQDTLLEATTEDHLYARRCARDLAVRLTELELEPDVHRLLPRIAHIMGEPVGDAAAINVLLMCEAARESGLKVMLSGMGADELFSGYRRHRACLMASRYRRLPLFTRDALAWIVDKVPVASSTRGYAVVRWGKRFLTFSNLDEEAAYRRSYSYYDPIGLASLLGGRSDVVAPLLDEHARVYWKTGRGSGTNSQLYRMFATDLHYFLPALNLGYVDRASMAASVEVRVPFVDVRLVKLATRLAARDRIRGSRQKYLLKEAARRWLSQAIVDRPKSSFGLPLRAWTRQELRESIREMVPNGQLVASGYLSRSAIEQVIAENERGAKDHAQALWQLLTLEHWFRAQSGHVASGSPHRHGLEAR